MCCPICFAKGRASIARGEFDGKLFVAEEVLAKHDENYMPPDVADMLKKNNAAPSAAPADGNDQRADSLSCVILLPLTVRDTP